MNHDQCCCDNCCRERPLVSSDGDEKLCIYCYSATRRISHASTLNVVSLGNENRQPFQEKL
jgi:hypothetical protein